MGAEHAMAPAALESARRMFVNDIEDITLEDALDSADGLRSILGLIKHTAAWAAVYHSFAFDKTPRSWNETDWPRGLRERIDASDAYLAEVIAWFDGVSARWLESVDLDLDLDLDLDEPRPVPWGETWQLREIIAYVAAHWAYHAGEINMILAIRRSEAWEYGEHVEENHISTIGHSVRRPWITDEYAEKIEREMRSAAPED